MEPEKGRCLMSVTFKRIIERKYSIISPTFGTGFNLESFVKQRKAMNMKHREFAKCFKCDKELNPYDELQIATVFGVGNRCFCHKCAKWINEEWDKCAQEDQTEVW